MARTPSRRPAVRGSARGAHRSLLLSLVRAHQPVSRADLARLMGTTRAAVTLLVTDLLTDGLLYEGGTGQTARGRKPTFLYLDSRKRVVAAVDIQPGATMIALTNLLAEPLVAPVVAAIDPKLPGFVKTLAARTRALVDRHRDLGRCEGVGVAVQGLIDLDGEHVRSAPGLGWRDVPLREMLADACRRPVLMESAGRACALSLAWRPRDAALDHIAVVSVGDGVSVGAVAGGQLLRGAANGAGDFGHLPIDAEGPPCRCGARGCWEVFVSDEATAARYAARPRAPSARGRHARASMTIDALVARARAGDRAAIAALRTTGRYLALGLAAIVAALDPGRIYLDGAVFAAWDLMEPVVRETLEPRMRGREISLVPLAPDERPRLRGAAALIAAYALAQTRT